MDKEIENKITMDKNKSKKLAKKKTVRKKESTTASKDIVGTKELSDLNGKFILVKVGNDNLPAKSADIDQIKERLTALFEENNVNCLTFVTHHAVDITVI